jgi:ubiquinone/menaquinone biosynthesis C-methylase UbiE
MSSGGAPALPTRSPGRIVSQSRADTLRLPAMGRKDSVVRSEDEEPSNGEQRLVARVERLRRFFDVGTIISRQVSHEDIVRYYDRSDIGYSLVHSRDGSIHMSLSEDGTYDPDGYRCQVNLVHEAIAARGALRVLELGCGRGYNLVRLGNALPRAEFIGIDLSVKHIRTAIRETEPLPNVHAEVGDFEDLRLGNQKFDFAYAIESLCHASTSEGVLSQIGRVVRPGGELLVIDAWRSDSVGSATQEQVAAIALTEKSMAVGHVATLTEWRNACSRTGWIESESRDLSTEVMPNLERFERLAKALIDRRSLAFIAVRTLPGDLMNNVVAGYLMAQSVREGLHLYRMTRLQRGRDAPTG